MKKSPVKRWNPEPSFMNVHQVSEYLQLNEKKVYALVNEGSLPATKVTGKWLFPRELVDRWVLDSAHGGLLSDRLLIGGGDDPLVHRAVSRLAERIGAHGLVTYTATSTRLGLEMLQSSHLDLSVMHWGPDREAEVRHPALLKLHPRHQHWVLVRGLRRETGVMLAPAESPDLGALLGARRRWATRQAGSGTRRFLLDALREHGAAEDDLEQGSVALSEREAAAAIVAGQAELAPGTRYTATEFGLGFISLGWERLDFVLDKRKWFRRLIQQLLEQLASAEIRQAASGRGYDFGGLGELAWGDE